MYVVMGATGNTGSVAAKTLLERGEKVRAVGRDTHKLAPLGQLGAEVVTADALDVAAMAKAFEGAAAAYGVLPPRAKGPGLLGAGEKMGTAITEAVQYAGGEQEVPVRSTRTEQPDQTAPEQA